MLRSIKALQGYTVTATDGQAAQVADFYFDDKAWVIRYLVADLNSEPTSRQALISPVALGQPDWEQRVFPISLTRQQVTQSPDTALDQPITQQYEASLHEYYQWPVYWMGDGIAPPSAVETPPEIYSPEEVAVPAATPPPDPHLRRVGTVIGYALQAKDGETGRVQDFIVNDETWAIGYMVVELSSGLTGHRQVLISPNWVESISLAEAKVYIDLRRETIENSPEYDPAELVNQDYEAKLYDYYGRPQ